MGLGTNNPTGMLHIYGANPPFRIQNSNDSANLQMGMWDTANIMLPIRAKKTYLSNFDCFKLFTNSIRLNKHFFH